MPNKNKNKNSVASVNTPSQGVIGPATSNTQEFGTYASSKGGLRKTRRHRGKSHKKTRRVR